MPVSREVRAAIGDLVIETTWIEYVAARLVRLAGITDNEMSLLVSGDKLFNQARRAAGKLEDPEVAERTRRWLREAEGLRRMRNQVVHSIVLHSHPVGWPVGWTAYHPKSGSRVAYSTREVVDLAKRVHLHAEREASVALTPGVQRG